MHGDFDDAVKKTREALGDHGFGVLTEIDVAAVLKAKLDLEHDPYLILGACNPNYASKAIGAEPSIGVLLPCNVVVRQADEDTIVIDFMDPAAAMTVVGNPVVGDVAHQVRSLLEQVRDSIAA